MNPFSQPQPRRRLRLSVVGTLVAAPLATAQTTFSIDYQGSTISVVDSFTATPITDGDILTTATAFPVLGPVPTPGILISGGPAGLGIPSHPGCVGHLPGVPCGIEVDALSFGVDARVQGAPLERWWFSVDEDAFGIPGAAFPNVLSEGAFGPAFEASADVFVDLGLPPGPLPPFAVPPANTGALDGNGMISLSGARYPGLGLLEPNLPGFPPHPGDNLDAVDVDGPIAPLGLAFYSLDAAFIDPLLGIPNTGSALANGFVGGDVLASPVGGGPPGLYAPAPALGLDLLLGPDSDDLDALVLLENGVPGYQPPTGPFSWIGAGATDMIFFSVRRGSAVIGAPDSIFGIPIEESDVLVPPFGGASPFPGIWIAGENLGLGTLRGGFPAADELNALDVLQFPLIDCNGNGVDDAVDLAFGAPDCNGNGIPDSCDIASGLSCDANGNLIPDECDWGAPVSYCVAKVSSFGVGCVPLIDSSGSPSITCPSPFLIDAANVNNFVGGLLFYGTSGPAAIPFLGGTLCVMPPLTRTPIQFSGGSAPFGNCTGSFSFDMNARIQSGIDPALVAGTTVWSQYWFRDTPNTSGVGLTNGRTFTICP